MKAGHLLAWIITLASICLSIIAVALNLRDMEAYLFVTFFNSGHFFAFALLLIFLVALYCGLDRLLFWISYDLAGARLDYCNGQYCESSFYHHFAAFTQGLKNRKENNGNEDGAGETVIIGEISENAYQHASDTCLDGQEITDTCRLLDYLTSVAPIVGFIGTLAGLMDSFGKLANGGDTQMLLSGLGVSMSTSLVGAFISVICISISWANHQLNDKFLDNIESITSQFHSKPDN